MLKLNPRDLPMEHAFGFTNFDHSIKPGTEEFLRQNPNRWAVPYAALNFWGVVAFDGEEFVIAVMQYGSVVETIRTAEFDEIMASVSDTYGWE